jgi:hypothetical protein
MFTRQESPTHFHSAGEGITTDASAELQYHLLAQALISNYEAKLVTCQTGISDTEIPALDINSSVRCRGICGLTFLTTLALWPLWNGIAGNSG